MCGICGCAGVQDNPDRVATMLGCLTHRGPDDRGVWHTQGLTLGHRRLAIVDLSKDGHQPMTTADGALTAVVNGEIYNYPDLRRVLEANGATFRSHSDSEVVLHAYRASGTASFSQFNGMFAYGLWDDVAQKLFVVRDRLGIKPVYYWHDPSTGMFCFASEIKALLVASGRSDWQIDAESLGQYLTYENLLGDRTLFEGIRMVPPGHYLEYDHGKIRIECYWQPEIPQASGPADFDDAVIQFKTTLASSVGRHLMSDVPVACYLSAGFDSSTVCAAAASRMPEKPLAFTGHFAAGSWYDESAGAAIVADHISVPIRKTEISADDFAQHLDHVVRSLDEPRMGHGAFSQFMVARAAAAERKVILTGHGGDELFSGYPVFKLASLVTKIRNFDWTIVSDIRSLKISELPHLVYFAMKWMMGDRDSLFLPILFDPKEQNRILDPSVFRAVDTARSKNPFQNIVKRARNLHERILLTYLKVYLPGLLVVEDKISMAHSLEARTPLLDNAMVDLSLSIQENIKLHNGILKAIVREAGIGVLPGELYTMPKRGFPTPLAAWLRGPLAGWLRDRLCGPHSRLSRIFKAEYAAHAVESYLHSWRRHVRPLDEIATHRIWMLLCLESWLRQTEELYGVSIRLDLSRPASDIQRV
jgi:asparagine synthase (glutamine-hydrolysing)